MTVDGVALNVEASIGIALAPDHAKAADELLQRADVALDRARVRRGRVEVYSPERDHSGAERLALLGEVRPALERGEFTLFYQPQIALRTGRVTGVEALLRWRHPQQGMIPPLQFISLIEQTALVGPLTLHVIDLALRQSTSWRQAGLELGMSVNLSARNLHDPELPAQIESALAAPRGSGGGAHAGGDRERRDGRPRNGGGGAGGAAHARGGGVDRRLRQRQRLDRLPGEAAGGRAEDRPLVRHPDVRERPRRGDRAHHDRPRTPPRAARGRRGHRDPRGVRAPRRDGLRHRPGLPDLTPRTGRGAHPLAGRPHRRRLRGRRLRPF